MSPKPPTRIRVTGCVEFPIGKYLVAKLCELGYDIVLSESYKYLPPFNKFYNITFDKDLVVRHNLVYEYSDFIFKVWGFTPIALETEELYMTQQPGVNTDDFVNFFVYCWGMNRGGRLPYDKHMEVTPEKIKEWKLRDLI